MTPDRIVVGEFRRQLLNIATAAINDTEVQVVMGRPWPLLQLDVVSIGAVTSKRDPATMSTNRTFTEELKAEILVSSWRPGGQEAEPIAHDRAYELLGLVDHAIRMEATTVGGVVIQCWLNETRSESEPFTQDTTDGRVTEILAEFVAMARITK